MVETKKIEFFSIPDSIRLVLASLTWTCNESITVFILRMSPCLRQLQYGLIVSMGHGL